MIINHNTAALVTNNALGKANAKAEKASKRLSTGYKINTAADDAAGLAIANKMKAQIRSLEMADRNCNDAISLVQTAEGGLSEVQNMIQRLRELAVQGSNDGLTANDREKIQDEVNALVEEIDSTSAKIQYNNNTLFDKEAASEDMVFQIGSNEGIVINFRMQQIDAGTLDVQQFTDDNMFCTQAGCENAIEICENALEKVSGFRAKLGSLQNRLDYTSASLQTSDVNAQYSLSRIQDTDMALEMTNYTSYNVITQAGISMLAQANQRPNQILSLLQ